MFVALWEFEVKPACEASFEFAYGPAGPWIALFQQDPQYLGSRLLRDPFRERIYLTIDFWTSPAAYQAFLAAHEHDYHAIDNSCATLTLYEKNLGAFNEINPVPR